jgi:hypothetical protein
MVALVVLAMLTTTGWMVNLFSNITATLHQAGL